MTDTPTDWTAPSNLVALFGIGASLIWNLANSCWNYTIRRKTIGLDHFNNHARRPLEPTFAALEEVIDTAHYIVSSAEPLAKKQEEVVKLRRSFHAARRVLTRKLMDFDNSDLIKGNDWHSLDEGDFDAVSEALDTATNAASKTQLETALDTVSTSLERLRLRVGAKLDECSKKLM